MTRFSIDSIRTQCQFVPRDRWICHQLLLPSNRQAFAVKRPTGESPKGIRWPLPRWQVRTLPRWTTWKMRFSTWWNPKRHLERIRVLEVPCFLIGHLGEVFCLLHSYIQEHFFFGLEREVAIEGVDSLCKNHANTEAYDLYTRTI